LSRYIGAATGATTSPTSSALAHDLIRKAGVDLVHGHSSHHSKAIEVYRGKLILYGCGDLINDDEGIGGYEKFRFRHDLTLMYFARIRTGDGKLQGLDISPFASGRCVWSAAATTMPPGAPRCSTARP